jgi:hypothetical protein
MVMLIIDIYKICQVYPLRELRETIWRPRELCISLLAV